MTSIDEDGLAGTSWETVQKGCPHWRWHSSDDNNPEEDTTLRNMNVYVYVCVRVCRLTFATSKDQATATRFPLREAVLEQRSWFTRTGHIEYANGLSTRHSCVKHARREHTHSLFLSKGRYLPLRFPLERNGTGGYRLAFQKLRAFFPVYFTT